MPGVSRLEAKMSLTDRHGIIGPLAVVQALSQTEWVGPFTTQVADGVVEQAIIVLGTQGLTTITALLITSDADISVTYGVAANNVPIPLNANGFHCMSDTSVTALSLSNSSGATANVTYFLAGS